MLITVVCSMKYILLKYINKRIKTPFKTLKNPRYELTRKFIFKKKYKSASKI